MSASPKCSSRVPRFSVITRPAPKMFDSALRYWVWSRHKPGVKYLVEIDAYKFNGICQCESFTFKLEPLLRRGFTAEQVVRDKLVKLKEHQRPEDALRCPHVIDAFMQWAEDAARVVHENAKNKTPPGFHAA